MSIESPLTFAIDTYILNLMVDEAVGAIVGAAESMCLEGAAVGNNVGDKVGESEIRLSSFVGLAVG